MESFDGKRILSHGLSYQYFIESFNNHKNKKCKFEGHPWLGTYEDATEILYKVSNNENCTMCTEMGYGASKNDNDSRIFLVITGTKAPYCRKLWNQLFKSTHQLEKNCYLQVNYHFSDFDKDSDLKDVKKALSVSIFCFKIL